MRVFILALMTLALTAPDALASARCSSARHEAAAVAKPYRVSGCRASARYRGGAPYPPTYLVDGRAYFYFPGEGGRPDEPVQPYFLDDPYFDE